MLLSLPPVTVDLDARTVRGEGRDDVLTEIEARLLGFLAGRPGRVVGKGELLAEVWGYGPRVQSRAIDTALARLRAKVEVDPAAPKYLLTVPGVGLRLDLPLRDDPLTFGRHAERAALTAGFERARLVTLVGPGGAGKTHLAALYARDRGVPLVTLEACTTEAELVRTIGATLSPGWDPRAVGRAALLDLLRVAGLRWLLLDNLEQAIGPASELVRALLDGSDVRVLATSREPLGLAGEAVVTVGGLDEGAAAALFAARAPPAREAGWADPVQVDGVLASLDRLPLAIELVAGWTEALPLSALADRLRSGLDLLVSERRDLPDRHKSLAGVVADSVRLLDPPTRLALEQLCVWSGELDAADAEAVVHPGPALVAVRALARRSLLRVTAPGRFRLYEAVRTHVRASSPPATLHAAGLHLARHLARLGDDDVLLRLAEVRASAVDLRTAVEAALEASDAEGGALEVAARCVRALAAVPGVDVDEALRTLDALEARIQGERGPEGLRDRVTFDRARLLWASGRLAEARVVVARLPTTGTPHARVRVLELAAAVARDGGDSERAVALLREALTVSPMRDDLRGSVLADLGTVLSRRGETAAAEAALDEALSLLRVDVGGARAAAMTNLALVYRETARDPLPLLTEALALHRAGGRRRSEAIVHGALGIARLDGGDVDGARVSFGEAVDVAERAGARQVAAVYRANRAYVDRYTGRTAEARAGYEAALRALREVGDTAYEALALGNLGELAVEDGRSAEGLALLDEALARARSAQFSKLEGVFLGSAGLERVRAGEVARGLEELARGEEILRAGAYRDELCRLLARRAQAAAALGEDGGAWLGEARSLQRAVPWVERAVAEAEAACARAPVSSGQGAPPNAR